MDNAVAFLDSPRIPTNWMYVNVWYWINYPPNYVILISSSTDTLFM